MNPRLDFKGISVAKTNNSHKLSNKDLKSLLSRRKQLCDQVQRIEDQLADRVDRIIQLICDFFDLTPSKPANWWFANAGSGEVGTLEIDLKQIRYEIETPSSWRQTGSRDYNRSFPASFMTMTDKQITQYLKRAHPDFQKRKADRIKELMYSASKKLTPDEWAALESGWADQFL